MEDTLTGAHDRPERIDRTLVGEPLVIGARTIQPVARLTGWCKAKDGASGVAGGGWVRLRPVEVIVREPDGSEQRVPVLDADRQAWQGILRSGLALAGVCLVLIAIRRLSRSQIHAPSGSMTRRITDPA